MSASHEWDEYHLTPAGWVPGDSKGDSGHLHQQPVPTNRLLTRRYTDRMSSPFSKVERYWAVAWTSGKTAEIGEALTKFGAHPDERFGAYRYSD